LSDLEFLTRRLIEKVFAKEEIILRLFNEYVDYKGIERESEISLAEAIYEECKNIFIKSVSEPIVREVLEINKAILCLSQK